MNKSSTILVTGASGLIGSALVRLLKAEGYENVLTPTINLVTQLDTHYLFERENPEYVFHLAACVGGIADNQDRCAEFIYANTQMQCNIFESSRLHGVKKLLFPGSACAYPANAEQPIKESAFLAGVPEATNLAYAVAKINGVVMAQSYAKQYGLNVVLPMVANTYGINDASTHVIPMLIKKFKANNPETILWGSGRPVREFIHADDVARAFLFLMLNYNSTDIINVGTEEEVSIADLAIKIAVLNGKKSSWKFDETKPDGIARKCLDSSKIRAMGWSPKVSLDEGLRRIYVNQ